MRLIYNFKYLTTCPIKPTSLAVRFFYNDVIVCSQELLDVVFKPKFHASGLSFIIALTRLPKICRLYHISHEELNLGYPIYLMLLITTQYFTGSTLISSSYDLKTDLRNLTISGASLVVHF